MSIPSGQDAAIPPAASGGRWFARLHTLLVLMLVLGCVGASAKLLSTVIMGVPGQAAFGFEGLRLPRAQIGLDHVLTSGTRVVRVAVEAEIRNSGHAPVVALLHLFTWLPGALTFLLALFWLTRITLPSAWSDAALFSVTTLIHLRRIGKVLILGSVAAFVLDLVAKSIAARILIEGAYVLPGDLAWPFMPVLTGIGAYVLAEVVRRGHVMSDELQGTI
ncbi:DUF2975 domain-containing protein [Sphaerisporangium fuscum]|uniref:DUF2975 domain-containing protein n=1 Tax=Sphaerisporangium fuscum TaxID=2835868 RepID=UPI001BDC6EF6|nr:DUF2975 domain-containing protein [Sphaerisporangium fuscum]